MVSVESQDVFTDSHNSFEGEIAEHASVLTVHTAEHLAHDDPLIVPVGEGDPVSRNLPVDGAGGLFDVKGLVASAVGDGAILVESLLEGTR